MNKNPIKTPGRIRRGLPPTDEGNYIKSVFQHKMKEYFFVNDSVSIVAPTKCASTSMRQYLEDYSGLENKASRFENRHGLLWKDVETRIVVIREPIQRYYSGVIESVKYLKDPNKLMSQSWAQHWGDHVNPMYKWIEADSCDFKYIYLHKLKLYINIYENDSMDSRSTKHFIGAHSATIPTLYDRMKRGREPLLQILYERDREWLDAEVMRYHKVVENMQECSVEEFRDAVARIS